MTTTSRSVPPGRARSQPERVRARRFGVRTVLAAVGVLVAAVPLTLLIVLVVGRSPGLRRFDQGIEERAHAYVVARPALEEALRVGSVALHPRVMWALVAVTALVLWRRGKRRHALWAVVTIAVGASLDTPLKELISRGRPAFIDPVAIAPGYSFPSGHALNTMVVGASAIVLGWRATRGRPWRRAVLVAAAAALVLATGFDRVGLGVHYVSDVVGGWLIGLAVVCITTAAFSIDVEPAERDVGEPATPAGGNRSGHGNQSDPANESDPAHRSADEPTPLARRPARFPDHGDATREHPAERSDP
jgi:membrane-associated phospholipid phosphatase